MIGYARVGWGTVGYMAHDREHRVAVSGGGVL